VGGYGVWVVQDIAYKYGIDDDMLNKDIKRQEVKNWIKHILNN
jgi:hypothetical protein